jgi:putative endonuclease
VSVRRGAEAEEIAARFLAARGLAIVARNFRCRVGEIDVIARDGDTLVFVEVRLRRRSRFGDAADSITIAKERKLVAAAELYLTRFARTPPCRFDAVLLEGLDARRIEWRRDVISA